MANFFNKLFIFAGTVESIAFVLAALGLILAMAWGQHGLKRLKKQQEARLWRWTAYLALTKLGLMAFTLLGQLYYTLAR
jgi:hypothetical protein